MPHGHLDNRHILCKHVVCYLGNFVDCHLKWIDHCKYVAAKATRSLNFLCHGSQFSSKVKSATHIFIMYCTACYGVHLLNLVSPYS